MPPKPPRTKNYTDQEDRILTRMFLDISQDPIIGRNQSKNEFWRRICQQFHAEKANTRIPDRTQRSLQCRMLTILKDCRKFNGCVRQVELKNPSGANEQNILEEAHRLLESAPGYELGFKFDHVWPMLKVFVQSEDVTGENNIEPPSFSPNPSLSSPNPSLSSFSINLSDDNCSGGGGGDGGGGGSSSQRPEGVKKAKLKRKQDEDDDDFVKTFKEENAALREVLLTGQNKRAAADTIKEENKTLRMRLDTIDDPVLREYFRMEQQQILLKRREAQATKQHNN